MRVHKINKETMKEIEKDGLSYLSYAEQIEISGGSDPGDAVHDLGYIIGKIGGWIVNGFRAARQVTDDTWMLDVDPKTLYS